MIDDGQIERDPVALFRAVQYIVGCAVPGDVLEFGVLGGQTAQVLATALRRFAPDEHRRLLLFDSFRGFPQADNPVDESCPHVLSGAWASEQADGTRPADVMDLCRSWEKVKIFPGWFRDTLPELEYDQRCALVHLDCDFYSSTKEVLEYLTGCMMLSDGCTLLFDDWYCNRGNPEWGQQRAFREVQEFMTHPYSFTDWGSYGVTGRRFIVHRKERS